MTFSRPMRHPSALLLYCWRWIWNGTAEEEKVGDVLSFPRRTLENSHSKVNRLTTRVNIEVFQPSEG